MFCLGHFIPFISFIHGTGAQQSNTSGWRSAAIRLKNVCTRAWIPLFVSVSIQFDLGR